MKQSIKISTIGFWISYEEYKEFINDFDKHFGNMLANHTKKEIVSKYRRTKQAGTMGKMNFNRDKCKVIQERNIGLRIILSSII